MPHIPLQIGNLVLGNEADKKDAVLCQLYNGYRSNDSLKMAPGFKEFADIGDYDVFTYYSTLHDKLVAVESGKIYSVDRAGAKTEITGASLTAGVRPTFSEDKDNIFIAARSEINRWDVGRTAIILPRRTESVAVSEVQNVTTLEASMYFSSPLICTGTFPDGAAFAFQVADKDNRAFRIETKQNDGAWTYHSDGTPGTPITFEIHGALGIIIAYGFTMQVRVVPQSGDIEPVASGVVSATVAIATPPTFDVAPVVDNITKTTADVTYTTGGTNYHIDYSLDGGESWTRQSPNEAPGEHTFTIDELTEGTTYRLMLRIQTPEFNATLVSTIVEKFTTSPETTAAATSEVSFSSQPVVTPSDTSVSITYTTAEQDNLPYKLEVTLNGADWTDLQLEEAPGEYTVEIPNLQPVSNYFVQLRATTIKSQSPKHVTSLTYISGFLRAVGNSYEGEAVPGDAWFSDNPGRTVWEVYNAEALPDKLQTSLATFSEVYDIGSQSVEISYLSGDPTNPFVTNKGAAQPFGTPAPYSVAFDQQSIYYLTVIGENRRLARLVGGREPQIISFDVDVPIDDIENVSDAFAFILGWKGESFYVITFPHAYITIGDQVHDALTLAFNIKTQEWYLWGEWDSQTGQYGAYKANTFTYAEPWHKRLVGGTDGKIYELAEEARITEPVFLHRWRNDGQKEWRGPRTVSLGQEGERRTPPKLWQFGQYTKRQDEWIFANGDTRMVIRTGWRNWGKSVKKSSVSYTYDVMRGDEGIVFNGIEEDVEPTQ